MWWPHPPPSRGPSALLSTLRFRAFNQSYNILPHFRVEKSMLEVRALAGDQTSQTGPAGEWGQKGVRYPCVP